MTSVHLCHNAGCLGTTTWGTTLRHRINIPQPPLERPSIEERHGSGHLFAAPPLPHLRLRIGAPHEDVEPIVGDGATQKLGVLSRWPSLLPARPAGCRRAHERTIGSTASNNA